MAGLNNIGKITYAIRMWFTVLFLSLCLQSAFAIDPEVREQMEKSTVRIEAKVTFTGDVVFGGQILIAERATRQLPNPHGSGFVISKMHIATNSHVAFEKVFFAKQIARQIALQTGLGEEIMNIFAGVISDKIDDNIEYFVVLSQTEKIPADVVWRANKKDLAILKTRSPINRPVVSFAPSEIVEDLQDVYVLGFPGSADYMGSTESPYIVNRTKGVISKRFFDDTNQRHLYATDAAINPGNSGGPMFDACGNVVGVSVEKAALENTEGAGFVIQIDELFPAMISLEIAYIEANIPCVPGSIATSNAFSSKNNMILIGGILFLTILLLGGLVWLKKSGGKKMSERDVSMIIKKKLANSQNPAGKNSVSGTEALEPISGTQAISMKLIAEGESWPAIYLQENVALKLGAATHCDVVLDHRHISGEHATVQAADGKVAVTDLNSTNGTYIGARKLPPQQAIPLHQGERLILGTEQVVYRLQDEDVKGQIFATLVPKNDGLPMLKIAKEKVVLGRDNGEINIDNTFLSGRHAMLWMEGGKLRVQDLDSYNGTFINNSKRQLPPKKTVVVNPGDWLIFGSKDVVYEAKY